MELNKKAAYLQGLVDGLGIDDTTKEGKIIKAMSALLGEMAEVIESVDEDLSRAYDQINDLSDELEDLEADLYEEDEDGESEDAEDEDSDGDDDDDAEIAAKGIYSLSGQKMNATDTRNLPKGIYIVNGKKTIIK